MLVVRPAAMDDADQLYALIRKSTYGLTTLKITLEQLQERIEQSEFAFKRKFQTAAGQPYVFVLQDLGNGQMAGTCSVYSKVGGHEPFYAYRIETSVHESEMLNLRKEIKVLHLYKEHDGPTEIGSLFLDPEYRGGGHGRLLSISRFLFIAQFPNRFDKEVIAEMRGVVDDKGYSPFWNSLGSHFFEIEFPKAEMLTTVSKNFIADVMPTHPIYIPLLPNEAQQVIGTVHEQTKPALAMLTQEGFKHRDLIDIFDGGPVMHCLRDEIRAVRESREATIKSIDEQVVGDTFLISNADNDFRVCLGPLRFENGHEVSIDRVTALTLQLQVGQPMRFVAPRIGTSDAPSAEIE